jgi:pilus assembly protein CpaF
MESDLITLQDVFIAKPPDEDSGAQGATRLMSPLKCTGLKPHFLEKMAANGVSLPPAFFQQDSDDQVRSTFQAASFTGLGR